MSSLTADELPLIFLSHSGQQKDFVTHLYHALLHAKQRPFFDKDSKDSLPSGLDYPTRIFEVCRSCKIGVVVLTEDYVRSLWPMLELQHLLLGPEDRPIYPLFYRLKPADLSNPANLNRWEEHWERKAQEWQSRMQELQEYMASSSNGSCRIRINLDIASWSHNLKMLQYRSGEVCNVVHVNPERSFYESDYNYIQVIVDNICARLPPDPMKYLLEVGVVGEKRMQQEISQVFEGQGSMGDDGVRVIGVYGIGGSGKSTLCKMMVNFYGSEFPGRCFFLELPTPDEGGIGKDDMLLLERIKAMPGYEGTNHTLDIDQAMKDLEKGLTRKEAFLAIDNVWDINLEYAQRLMRMKFVPRTKIMITSRSKEIVSRLLLPQSRHENKEVGDGQFPSRIHRSVVHVPSLGEDEAVQALKRLSPCASFIPEEDLRKLARSCFFEEQCHPLYLKLKGKELEQKGHPSFQHQQWSNLISSLIVHEESSNWISNFTSEKVVLRAVEKSFEALPSSRLQDIFIDLVTFQSSGEYKHEKTTFYDVQLSLPYNGQWWLVRSSLLDFVRLQYDDFTEDEMFSAALAQQYHGLLVLENKYPGTEKLWPNRWRVIIHDLHKVVANRRVALPNIAHADAPVKISSCGRTYETVMRGKYVTIRPDQIIEAKPTWLRALSGSRQLFTIRPDQIFIEAKPTWLRALFGSRQLFKFGRLDPVQVQARFLNIDCSARFSSLNKARIYLRSESRNLEALRVLSLGGCGVQVQEIRGWRGVPNLALLQLYEVRYFKRIEPMGCLKKLEKVMLLSCSHLDIHSLVGGSKNGGAGRSLFKDGDCLPRLQEIAICENNNLVEGGALSDAFPALTKLTLIECPKLRRVESSFSSLEHLHLLHESDQCIVDVAGSLTTLISVALPVCKQSAGNSQSAHANKGKIKCEFGRATYSVLSFVTGAVFHSSSLSVGHPGSSSVPKLPSIYAPRLRALSLICASESPDVYGLHVSVDMPSLEYLSLIGFASVQKLTFESSVVKLKSVLLEGLVSLEEINGLGAYHGKLQHITIKNCPSLARILDADSKNSLPALTVLRWSGRTSFTDASCVAGLATLTTLDLSSCTSLTNVAGVSGLTSLTSLILNGCTSLTNVAGVSGLISLTSLRLNRCTSLTNVAGVSGLTSLTSLTLDGCTSLTNVAGVSGFTSLTSLTMDGCTSLTNVAGVSGLTSLTYLDLDGCTSLTNVAGVSGLTSLTSLYMRDCISLTDVSSVSGLTSLTTLSLRGWNSLTNVCSVSSLASLTFLDLSGCTSLTNVTSVFSLASLRYLNLRECTSLTDVSGVSGLTSLSELDLRGCTSLANVPSVSSLGMLLHEPMLFKHRNKHD